MPFMTRRDFLGSCAVHLAAAAALVPCSRRSAWAQSASGRIIAREPFGYLEQVAEGVWALISTPLQGQRTTLCNGGIIAGKSGVLAIEGFFEPQGAAWLAGKARELTGRWPTHVVVTHFHADHTNGVAGYLADAAPTIHATAITRDLTLHKGQPDVARADAMQKSTIVPVAMSAAAIDLGGRSARLMTRQGHTPSDVSVELSDPDIVFCGDLVWNAMFPNYVDAIPSDLGRAVRDLRKIGSNTIYIPGHGALARAPELDRYIAVLDEVEQAARRARESGLRAADAASQFSLPKSLGEWALFNPAFFERAFTAWYRQLP